jgi:hypothetical protein
MSRYEPLYEPRYVLQHHGTSRYNLKGSNKSLANTIYILKFNYFLLKTINHHQQNIYLFLLNGVVFATSKCNFSTSIRIDENDDQWVCDFHRVREPIDNVGYFRRYAVKITPRINKSDEH